MLQAEGTTYANWHTEKPDVGGVVRTYFARERLTPDDVGETGRVKFIKHHISYLKRHGFNQYQHVSIEFKSRIP